MPKIKKTVKIATGYAQELTTAMSNQDLAASGVAKALYLEVEACVMHQSDKTGTAYVGNPTRSRNLVVANPFPEGQLLTAKCRD